MLTATMAFELKKDNILVVCVNPGLVGTDMAKDAGDVISKYMGEYCLKYQCCEYGCQVPNLALVSIIVSWGWGGGSLYGVHNDGFVT